MIVCDGVNDIGGSRPDSAAAVALHLIDAYGEMIRRAHARGIKVYGATVMPFGGYAYFSREHDAARVAVNAWIRRSGSFDAVIDFDAATRDSARPEQACARTSTGGIISTRAPPATGSWPTRSTYRFSGATPLDGTGSEAQLPVSKRFPALSGADFAKGSSRRPASVSRPERP